jgi:hypothetical protein
VTLTISGNNVNLLKRGQNKIKKITGTKYNEHIGEKKTKSGNHWSINYLQYYSIMKHSVK